MGAEPRRRDQPTKELAEDLATRGGPRPMRRSARNPRETHNAANALTTIGFILAALSR